MKKILLFILVLSMCIGLVACDTTKEPETDTTQEESTAQPNVPESEAPDKTFTLACSFDTVSYDLAALIGGRNHRVSKNGEQLDGSTVKLDIGTNVFDVVYTVSSIERTAQVRIARRSGYRVVFNTNGGSFIETQYVKDCAVIDESTVVPTRNRYTFAGWYNEKGEKVTLSTLPIQSDTTFIAHWEGPNTFEMPSKTPLVYTTSSAALNINWKDYDNAFGLRPTEVTCTLKDTKTGTAYSVKVTKTSAEFVGAAPAGAAISQGAGNWTVKITGLTGDYTFLQDAFRGTDYVANQSGTTVYNTLANYSPMYDDTSALMTENGRFYDVAGNVVVLKGVVPWNADNGTKFTSGTSTNSLKRLKEEGCNVIRITVPLGATTGYQNVTPEKQATYVANMKAAVSRAAELGMYCIVDWGVMYNAEKETYLAGLLEPAKDFFGKMSEACKDNPYIIYELANEPTANWEKVLRPWEETLIRHIRAVDVDATIIAAPSNHSRHLSLDNEANGNDPIDRPFPTEISYNVAHTFHCYAYTTTYNADYDKAYRDDAEYGWRVCDAVINGLTIVITEFSPANASMDFEGGFDNYGLDADYMEANKWLNFIFENDVNYTLFRYGESPNNENKVKAQFMFTAGKEATAYTGKWTYDMLTDSGKWYYDNVLHATGFIKAADFDYRYNYK